MEINMRSKTWIIKIVLMFFLLVTVACTLARAESEGEFTPSVGQAGKDVVWVPTKQVLVDKMLDMAKVTPDDYLIDLGSGDGIIVITAAKRGIRAHGIEYNPDMVELSRRNAAKEGVSDKATFAEADIFESDFSKATVISMFLLPSLNLQLRPKILDLKPGTRIVSNTFDMSDWIPDEVVNLTEEECTGYCTAIFWIVPAKVGGTWKLQQGELTLDQTFQMITGELRSGNVSTPINGKLEGNQISFSADDITYTGSVSENSMKGAFTGGSSGNWSATRIQEGEQ
jgi:hypothetical protein